MITYIAVYREKTSQFPVFSFCMNLNNSKSIIPDINDVIVTSQFDSNQCNATEFEITEEPFSRVCYRFNSRKNAFNQSIAIRNSTRNTLNTGLIVHIDAEKFGFTNLNFRSKIYAFKNNESAIFITRSAYYYENIINLVKGIV